MRPLVLLLALCVISNLTIAQAPSPKYNKKLADSLQADDYGMRWYIMAMLKSGNKKLSKDSVRFLYKEHMNFISSRSKSGQLIISGPMGKNSYNYRSLFLINSTNIEVAKEILEQNPAVKEGLFEADYFYWYSSAAIPAYKRLQPYIELKKP